MNRPSVPGTRPFPATLGGVAIGVLAAVLIAEFLASRAWLAGASSTAAGELPFFPGSSVHHAVDASGGSLGWQPGWLGPAAAVVVVLAMLLVRAVDRRGRATPR